jgi:predicted DNA-binding transcriptional regulator AlpA
MRAELTREGLEAGLPPLLTTKQTAKLCGCGERTLWRWSRSGVAPPPVKIGGGARAAVRYRRDEYLEWIAGGCLPVDGRGRQ